MDRDCNMEVGIKRKRGRPRKIESSSIISSSSSGRDEMVGQVICGVVEASFEAGYLVNVQLTSSIAGEDDHEDNNNLRGVVFRGDKVCPITITNDVAPHAKMYLRKHHTTTTLPSTSIIHLHNQQHSSPINPPPNCTSNYKPSPSTCSTTPPFLVPLLSPNTHHHKPNPPEEDDDDDMQVDDDGDDDDDNDDNDINPPPKNTCKEEDHQEQADQLFLTRQLLNPTNTTTTTTTTTQLFINSTTNYMNTNNLNLELNQPPTTTTTTMESQPPKRKLMDMFPTATFSNHSTSSSSPQLLHPISMALAGRPIATTQGRIIVDHHPTTAHSPGSARPSTNTTCN